MLTINLLPWRDIAQEKKYKKNRLMVLLTIFILLGFSINAHLYLNKRIVQHTKILLSMKHELAQWIKATSIDKTAMTTEKSYPPPEIEKNMNLIFTALLQNNPKNICFHALDITNNDDQHTIIFSGKASSLNELTDFFKNWPMAPLFSDISINTIKKIEDHVEFTFTSHLLTTSI